MSASAPSPARRSIAPPVAAARARVAGLSKKGRDAADPELVSARQELRVQTLADQIQRTIDQAPPLSDEQRARLARLLAPQTDGLSR